MLQDRGRASRGQWPTWSRRECCSTNGTVLTRAGPYWSVWDNIGRCSPVLAGTASIPATGQYWPLRPNMSRQKPNRRRPARPKDAMRCDAVLARLHSVCDDWLFPGSTDSRPSTRQHGAQWRLPPKRDARTHPDSRQPGRRPVRPASTPGPTGAEGVFANRWCKTTTSSPSWCKG